jgi:hypothetical protein
VNAALLEVCNLIAHADPGEHKTNPSGSPLRMIMAFGDARMLTDTELLVSTFSARLPRRIQLPRPVLLLLFEFRQSSPLENVHNGRTPGAVCQTGPLWMGSLNLPCLDTSTTTGPANETQRLMSEVAR